MLSMDLYYPESYQIESVYPTNQTSIFITFNFFYVIKYYHIQIYNGQDINKARSIKSMFTEQFPDVTATIEWESPEFKVWIGDYETKLAADQALLKFKPSFPNAFVVNPKK